MKINPEIEKLAVKLGYCNAIALLDENELNERIRGTPMNDPIGAAINVLLANNLSAYRAAEESKRGAK